MFSGEPSVKLECQMLECIQHAIKIGMDIEAETLVRMLDTLIVRNMALLELPY